MYGAGFGPEGDDDCTPRGHDNSYVYRIDTTSLEIDEAIKVGAVPKYVAVTPDAGYVLVTNWCTYDLASSTPPPTRGHPLPIGRLPSRHRVSPDTRTAYVAVMGVTDITVVDLTNSR